MREADDACFAGAALYVDTDEALQKSGDLLGPMRAACSRPPTCAARSPPSRRGEAAGGARDAERTVFKSVGTALEDLAAAVLVQPGRRRAATLARARSADRHQAGVAAGGRGVDAERCARPRVARAECDMSPGGERGDADDRPRPRRRRRAALAELLRRRRGTARRRKRRARPVQSCASATRSRSAAGRRRRPGVPRRARARGCRPRAPRRAGPAGRRRPRRGRAPPARRRSRSRLASPVGPGQRSASGRPANARRSGRSPRASGQARPAAAPAPSGAAPAAPGRRPRRPSAGRGSAPTASGPRGDDRGAGRVVGPLRESRRSR